MLKRTLVFILVCTLLQVRYMVMGRPVGGHQDEGRNQHPPTLADVTTSPSSEYGDRARSYLSKEMDKYHKTVDVYSDADAANNHFHYRALISSRGGEDAVPPMVEDHRDNPYEGLTCINAQFKARGDNWGGWYFMNGLLPRGATKPVENWGDYPNAGLDLRGATKLTFYARGERGGERVEFFALGVGWDPDKKPFPDSSPKVSTGAIELKTNWTLYTIELTGLDLSYVLGGFGWAAAAANNRQDISFFVDNIQYDKSRLNEPRFIASFQTVYPGLAFDRVLKDVAFLSDNAVAVIAFLAAGETERARLIAAAMVYAQEHDQFYRDGRLRNAYAAGDLALPPGWTPNGAERGVRSPGYTDRETMQFIMDEYQQSTNTGNLAWAMIALLAYHRVDSQNGKYLNAAKAIGNWIMMNCRDNNSPGGFTAGFDGFESNSRKATRKATEQNILTAVAFKQLYELTGVDDYRNAATHAQEFVDRMYEKEGGRYWIGTGDDGSSIVASTLALNAQALPLLALGSENTLDTRSLAYAESHHKLPDGGYDYNQDRDGVWFEGTCLMAIAQAAICQQRMSSETVNLLKSNQSSDGALPLADRDGVTTGLLLGSGPWFLFRRAHIGATAWFLLADRAINPFSNPPGANPLIKSVSLRKKELTIFGAKFCNVSSVMINNVEKIGLVTMRDSTFIKVKGKAKKLGLRTGQNTVQIIDSQTGASNILQFTY